MGERTSRSCHLSPTRMLLFPRDLKSLWCPVTGRLRWEGLSSSPAQDHMLWAKWVNALGDPGSSSQQGLRDAFLTPSVNHPDVHDRAQDAVGLRPGPLQRPQGTVQHPAHPATDPVPTLGSMEAETHGPTEEAGRHSGGRPSSVSPPWDGPSAHTVHNHVH